MTTFAGSVIIENNCIEIVKGAAPYDNKIWGLVTKLSVLGTTPDHFFTTHSYQFWVGCLFIGQNLGASHGPKELDSPTCSLYLFSTIIYIQLSTLFSR